jgi:polygalacturonase
VTIAHSFFHTGDDQVAIKGGGETPTSHISIVHNHFYTGHGMSIGSETYRGVSSVYVSDLSIDGSDNGLRIKSNITRGGLVHDVRYEDVCIRDTANPVMMDTSYTAHESPTKDLSPQFRDVVLRNVRVQGAGKVMLEAVDASHRLGIQFDNVIFDDPGKIKVSAKHADVKVGPGAFNLKIAGEDTKVSGTAGSSTPNACTEKFVPFPMR